MLVLAATMTVIIDNMKRKTISVSEAAEIAKKYLRDRIIPESFSVALTALVEAATDRAPAIKGWVARDEDHSLWFHFAVPYRSRAEEAQPENGIWHSNGRFLQINSKGERTIFRDLSWNDDPIEAGLFIKPFSWFLEQSASNTDDRIVTSLQVGRRSDIIKD